MTPEHRMEIVGKRTANYYDIMRTTMFVFAIVAAALAFAPGAFNLGLCVVALAATACGVLAGGSAPDDPAAYQPDTDGGGARRHFLSRPRWRPRPFLAPALLALI